MHIILLLIQELGVGTEAQFRSWWIVLRPAFEGVVMEAENGDAKFNMADYEVIEQLERGVFGAVFVVLHKIEQRKYVLKRIRLTKQTEKFKHAAHHEMNLIARLNNPYLVEFKDAWVEKGCCVCIVTAYYDGDMANIIKKARGAFFSEEKLCSWLTQLLLAMDYLHSIRVVHTDLKCSNIFLTNDGEIRLGDFVLAKLLSTEGLASSIIGTPKYMCPELLAGMPYGYKSDIWSLGCCMFEIAARQPAFRAPDMAGLVSKINRSAISPLPIVYSSTLKQIIKSMLRKSPEHRPTAAELLRHPHLQPCVLQCRNLSSVFLPVKPGAYLVEDNVVVRMPISSKASDVKDTMHKVEEAESVKPLTTNADHQLAQTSNKEKPISMAMAEEALETKRVDPTSYSTKASYGFENLEAESSGSERTVSDGNEPAGCSTPHIETGKASNLKHRKPEGSLPVSGSVPRLQESNAVATQDVPSTNQRGGPQEAKVEGDEMKADSNSSAATHFDGAEDPGSQRDSISSGSNGKPQGSFKPGKDDSHGMMTTMKRESGDVSLMGMMSAMGDEQSRMGGEDASQQRADALESLLEVCAQLLQQNKLEELAGVLKPFGRETVSSRETAIWLTKSLMAAQKSMGGT